MSGASSPALSPGDELDFDFGAWCPVCERAIPSVTTARPPLSQHHSNNSNELPTTSNHGDSSQPSTSAAGGATKGRRSSGKKEKEASGPSGGIGPRRKSSTRLHHAGGSHHRHHKSHSNTSLAALAGLAPLAPAAAPAKEVHLTKEERMKEKERIAKEKEERVEREEVERLNSLNPPTSLYCSEECKRIDEMRSRLAFADLGPSSSMYTTGNNHSHSQSSQSQTHSHRPTASTSSSHQHSPNRSSSSQQFLPDLSMSRRRPSHTSLSSSALNSATVSQLDFSTRRNSRGNQLEGGYSYRPQMMTRMSSSEDGGGSANWGRSRGSTDSLASMGEADERSDRSYSGAVRPPSALSAFRFMTPISATHSSSPPSARSAGMRRPPNLSRHNSDAPRPTTFRTDSDERDESVSTETTSTAKRSSSKTITSPPLPSPRVVERTGVDSDPGGVRAKKSCTVGSSDDLATARTSPVLSITSSSLTSPPALLSRNSRRSASSASLSLMGSSLGKSYERGGNWGMPKRSESTASLSGLMALGEMIPVSGDQSSTTWNGSSSTFVPPPVPSSFRSRNASIPRLSTSPSSPSSNSSFAHSHSSNRSSQRSTAGSSDHTTHDYGRHYPQYGRNLSSNSLNSVSGHSHSGKLSSSVEKSTRGSTAGVGNGRRGRGGLMMTPSASSLSNVGSYTDPNRFDSSRPTTSYGESGDDCTAHVTSGSFTSERTPTQSLSKAASLRPAGGSMVNLAGHSSTEGMLHSVNEAICEEVDEQNGLHGEGTIKRRSKESRAMSNPSTAKRPAALDLGRAYTTGAAALGNGPPSPVSPTVAVNAATLNPSLSYLHGNAVHHHPHTLGHSSSTGRIDQKSRNWSWDNLHVPTYQALDLDKVRRDKEKARVTATAITKDGERRAPESNAAGSQDQQQASAPPKERKRLFYFSDAGEMDG